ncbi:MAG: YdcF family protein [Pseudomonadota bacterium]|jgi:uncharacterized SAM-binding protein YcdF (DUF218 family)
MFLVKKILATLLLPPMGPILLAALGLALLRRQPRLGRLLAGSGLLSLYLLSIPAVTDPLLATLQIAPPVKYAQLRDAQAIVVLGGGRYREAPEYGIDTVNRLTLERLRYGARLARTSGLPLLVSGGAPFGGRPEAEAMAEALAQDFGVPVRWVENASRDTRENARFSAALLRREGIARVILVSHAWHMRRALAEFSAAGLQTVPAPTGFVHTTPPGVFDLLPGKPGMSHGYYAVHEWLGILAQRLAGIGG